MVISNLEIPNTLHLKLKSELFLLISLSLDFIVGDGNI
nr:MAG TPA: hypothetical protein [Inoviridae sp.]